MAGGMNKRGSGIPMHERVALGRASAEPHGHAQPEPPAPAKEGTSSAGDSLGRHCWVLTPADGSGERRPGLLVEWRRGDDGIWRGRVVYLVRLRTGDQAVLDEWLPQADLAPR